MLPALCVTLMVKGIVCGRVDNTHLRAYTCTHDVTATESMGACLTENDVGLNSVDMVQRLNDTDLADRTTVFAEVDMRSHININTSFRDVGTLYGERPCDESLFVVISL